MGNIKSSPLPIPFPFTARATANKGRDRRARKEIDRLQEDLDELYNFIKKVEGTTKGKSVLEEFVVRQMASVSESKELFLLEVSERSGTDSVTSFKTADTSTGKRGPPLVRAKSA